MKGKNKNEQNDDTGDDLRGYGGVCRERCGRRQIDYVVGKRSAERTKNPSAYPQTSDEKFPANLTVRVGGKVALKRVLPDDPADHRCGPLGDRALPYGGRDSGPLGDRALPGGVVGPPRRGGRWAHVARMCEDWLDPYAKWMPNILGTDWR